LVVREEIQFKAGEVRCPRCMSKDLAPSLPRGLRDAFMRTLHRIPRHCRVCGRRFYVPESKPVASAGAPEQP
jgi:hypothetical protein